MSVPPSRGKSLILTGVTPAAHRVTATCDTFPSSPKLGVGSHVGKVILNNDNLVLHPLNFSIRGEKARFNIVRRNRLILSGRSLVNNNNNNNNIYLRPAGSERLATL